LTIGPSASIREARRDGRPDSGAGGDDRHHHQLTDRHREGAEALIAQRPHHRPVEAEADGQPEGGADVT